MYAVYMSAFSDMFELIERWRHTV